MSLGELLFGRPLSDDEAEEAKIGALQGVPVLGLDAIASSAYGPEAALTVLLAAGAAGQRFFAPIVAAITAILLVVYLSELVERRTTTSCTATRRRCSR